LPKYKSRESITDIELNARCDSCSARAKYLVLLKAGHLFFCGHHLKKNKSSLEALSSKKSIVDIENKLEKER
jgi:hypothetical protein